MGVFVGCCRGIGWVSRYRYKSCSATVMSSPTVCVSVQRCFGEPPEQCWHVCRWQEDLRFRLKDSYDSGSATVNIELKDAPSSLQYLGGSTIGKATIDASIIVGELDKLRADALNTGAATPLASLPNVDHTQDQVVTYLNKFRRCLQWYQSVQPRCCCFWSVRVLCCCSQLCSVSRYVQRREICFADNEGAARRKQHRKGLLPSKPVGGLSVNSQKALSKRAKQVKVASRQGEGPTSYRTDIAEAWVPLQGAGSDARMLLRLQGALRNCGPAVSRDIANCESTIEACIHTFWQTP